MVTAQERGSTDTAQAADVLREALAAAGIVLPSLGADMASPSLQLVTLGRVHADVAFRLAEAVRPATVAERLSRGVALANARSREERL